MNATYKYTHLHMNIWKYTFICLSNCISFEYNEILVVNMMVFLLLFGHLYNNNFDIDNKNLHKYRYISQKLQLLFVILRISLTKIYSIHIYTYRQIFIRNAIFTKFRILLTKSIFQLHSLLLKTLTRDGIFNVIVILQLKITVVPPRTI